MGWDIKRFTDPESIIDDLICSICKEVLEEPVQAPCEHTFCNKCIKQWLDRGEKTCPVDRQKLTSVALSPPTRVTKELLDQLIIRCKNHVDSCHLMCKFEYMQELIQHEQMGCQAGNDGGKREIHRLEKKIMELQNALSVREETISRLEMMLNEKRNPMEASALEPSAPPIESLESTSMPSKLEDHDLPAGTRY